jgi:hypothetical protein
MDRADTSWRFASHQDGKEKETQVRLEADLRSSLLGLRDLRPKPVPAMLAVRGDEACNLVEVLSGRQPRVGLSIIRKILGADMKVARRRNRAAMMPRRQTAQLRASWRLEALAVSNDPLPPPTAPALPTLGTWPLAILSLRFAAVGLAIRIGKPTVIETDLRLIKPKTPLSESAFPRKRPPKSWRWLRGN